MTVLTSSSCNEQITKEVNPKFIGFYKLFDEPNKMLELRMVNSYLKELDPFEEFDYVTESNHYLEKINRYLVIVMQSDGVCSEHYVFMFNHLGNTIDFSLIGSNCDHDLGYYKYEEMTYDITLESKEIVTVKYHEEFIKDATLYDSNGILFDGIFENYETQSKDSIVNYRITKNGFDIE